MSRGDLSSAEWAIISPVELCALVNVNLHALAIDEQRKPFEATPWRKSKFNSFDTVVEQVWFPVAHADVRGGYIPEEQRQRNEITALDDLTLDWMLKRLRKHFPDFPASEAGWPKLTTEALKARALAEQHQSRNGAYFLWPRAFRSLNDAYVKCRRIPVFRPWSEINVGRDRHEEPSNEMIHISALERPNRQIRIAGKIRIQPQIVAITRLTLMPYSFRAA